MTLGGLPNQYFDMPMTKGIPVFCDYPFHSQGFVNQYTSLVPMTDFGALHQRLTILPPLVDRGIGDSLLGTPQSAFW